MPGHTTEARQRVWDKLQLEECAPELLAAALGMRRIIEEIDGVMNHGTWRDERGLRLKDTKEWVALYNAISKSEGHR